jgi:Flp pilus assembly protein TadB
MSDKPTTEDVMRKYGAKIESQMNNFEANSEYSKSYQDFRKEMSPNFSTYERWCKSLGNVIKMNPSKKDSEYLQKQINIAHLNISASEAAGLSVVSFSLLFVLGLALVVSIWLIFLGGDIESFPGVLIFLLVLFSIFVYYYTYNLPQRLATEWRLKASAQMVPAILYVVIYMKHTSNFEKAISFASQHLDEPLASDFKKIFWDVEVGRYSNVKESVDHYLETWRDYSLEFIEAFHLIESSLYEPSDSRRVAFLEKSLQVILDGVYDKMLKYTHNVKAPLTNLYMLGIVLPTLSLAILPLAASMLSGSFKWFHLIVVFNVLIPFFVIFMTGKIILERPGGYGESSMLSRNPLYSKYASLRSYWVASLIMLPFIILGFLPLFWRYVHGYFNLPLDPTWGNIGLPIFGKSVGIFGLTEGLGGVISGPMGLMSLLLSMLIPLSIALIFIIGSSVRTKELLVEREKYKEVEAEFTSSLFQLGNRLGDGNPPEIAFAKVIESTKGTSTEGFFRLVNQNIQQLGMSVEQALFNPKRGALIFYPSHLIETSMKILVESSKKGLQVAARSLMSISDYVKNIKKIDERLTDLLADIISDMKSNMTFLAPLLSGIIVGLSGMITGILNNLSSLMKTAGTTETAGFNISNLLTLFNVNEMIPPYWVQVCVGLYLIEIIFILTGTLVTIKSGKDELQTTSEIGYNLKVGMVLYLIVALISVLALSLLGATVLKQI